MKFQHKFLHEKAHLRSINMVWSVSSPWITALSWWRALRNSMKLWAMPCRPTQDGWVIVKSSDKTWSTGGGNGKAPQYSCCENPMNSDAKSLMNMMWRADSLEKTLMLGKIEGERRRRRQRMRWLDSISNSVDMNLSKVQEIEKDREPWRAALHGV